MKYKRKQYLSDTLWEVNQSLLLQLKKETERNNYLEKKIKNEEKFIKVDRSDFKALEKRLEEGDGERERLENRLFGRGEMNNAPCFFCGYNGSGYFQPETHACAAKHHRIYPGTKTSDSEENI